MYKDDIYLLANSVMCIKRLWKISEDLCGHMAAVILVSIKKGK